MFIKNYSGLLLQAVVEGTGIFKGVFMFLAVWNVKEENMSDEK